MKCPLCQAENADGARFCEECGARLAFVCPGCGQPVGAGKKFCWSCGAPLTAESVRLASPESYTPKHLAEKVRISKSALEGERKQVTVLFADLKSSMELLAERDPEEARQILDPVLTLMMDAVHRYEGTVNRVMGDGIMALFGAPLAHEDHAVRACYAALDMQAAVRRFADEVRRSHGIGMQIRVGLNSGEVVVRAIGNDLHMDYSAIGQTTHLAARMEQLASPGNTLLTGDTLRLAEGYVEVKPLGPVPVKGLETPIEVYEMVGTGLLRSRLQAAATRGLTRLVGRDSELDLLRHALERAAAGRGQIVALVGEAGVGKSRLVWEVTHSRQVHGWLVLESGSVSYGKATPYLPVVNLLKAYFTIQDRDDHDEIREKVSRKLRTFDGALAATSTALLSLLDLPVEDPPWRSLDPPQRRQRTLDAVKRLLLRKSQAQPLLLVFEDLHWIDSETQALRQPRRKPPDGPDTSPGQPPSRVPARMGQQDLLRSAPAGPVAAREGRGPPASPHRRQSRASTTQAPLDPAHRGEPVLPGGKRSDAGRDQGARRRARRLPPREGASEHSGARHGASGTRGADRPSFGG